MTVPIQQNPRAATPGLSHRAAAGGNPPASGQPHLSDAKPDSRSALASVSASLAEAGALRTFFQPVGGTILFLGLPLNLFTAGQLRNRLLSEALREARVNSRSGLILWSAYHQLQKAYGAVVAFRDPKLQPMESL